MQVGILGPLEVHTDDGPRQLGGSRQRAVLAYLALHAGQVVPTEQLLVELWGENTPPGAANTLQAAVSRLRKVLPADRLLTQAPGYVLRLDDEDLDLDRFTSGVAGGRRRLAEDAPLDAGRLLRGALGLWRGPALAEFRYEPFAQAHIARLEELRLAAVEERIDADLAAGEGAGLVAELAALVAGHPLRERLRAQYMRALYRSGRQSEALETFRELRAVLAEELGIDPSPELADLESAVLRQDPLLLAAGPAAPRKRPAATPGPPPVPTPVTGLPIVRRQSPQQLPGPKLPYATDVPAPSDRQGAAALVRRPVSVLVVDVRAATADGAPLDPEALNHLQQRAAALLSPVLDRCGGRPLTVSGHRLSGVFGVVTAHEDDALRATRAADEARAALAGEAGTLRRELRVELVCRFGVATGEALVGGPAPGFVGWAAEGAAELADVALPWQVLLDPATRELTGAAAEVTGEPGGDRLALTAVRPGARPVPVRLDGPVIGRDHELARLEQAVADAAAGAGPVLVTVLGDAGIGKTRLVVELSRRLPGTSRMLLGRCPSFGEGITFAPLRELVRQALSEAGPEARLEDLLAGEPDAAVVAGRLARAFGDGDAGGQDAAEIFWATRRLLEVLARRAPLVVVLDDVHWAEPMLLDLVDHVLRTATTAPLTVVCLARPELLESRPGWGEAAGGRVLALEPLARRHARELVASLAPTTAAAPSGPPRAAPAAPAAPAWDAVLDAAGGNPLYLEQLVAAHGEGDPALAAGWVPRTVQALLAARLDRLGPGERDVLTCASIAGKDVGVPGLAELLPPQARARLDRHLEGLVARGLLVRRGSRDEPRYAFRHALIQQAAYRAVPKTDRVRLHTVLAGWIEADPRAARTEQVELAGYHLEQAARYLRELRPFDPETRRAAVRAARLLRLAGAAAHEIGDAPAAVRLFERADLVLPADEPLRAELLTHLGAALFGAGRLAEAGHALDRAIALAVEHDDDMALAHARVESLLLGLQTDSRRAEAEALRGLTDLRRVFDRQQDFLGLCRTGMLEAAVHWTNARSAAAERCWTVAADHARAAGDRRHLVECLCWLASAALWGPTPADVGIARCDGYLAEMEGIPTGRAEVFLPLAGLHAMRGDGARAEELLARGIAILAEVGDTRPTASTEPAALVAMLGGRPERAEQVLRAEYRSLRGMGEKAHLATVGVLIAQALVAQGPHRHAEAEELVAGSRADAGDDPVVRMVGNAALARVLSTQGEHDKAVALAEVAVATAGRTDLTALRADALLDLARVLHAAGRADAALRAVSQARDRYRSKGNLAGLAVAEELLVGVSSS